MVHDQIEFHNVGELVTVPGANGLALYRYPRDVIDALTPLCHHVAAASSGVELRFVSATAWLSLTSSHSGTAEVPSRGSFASMIWQHCWNIAGSSR